MAKKRSQKPLFIVIEALDAGGSQTQTDYLVRRLKKEGFTPHQYHFPQEDKATGRLIYDKFLLHKNKRPFSSREQALLYIQDFFSQADAMQAVLNAKRTTNVVVSDRYVGSTLAYQTIDTTGRQREALTDWITWLCWEGSPALPTPDLVLFLDTPVAVSLQRLEGKNKDFFETKERLTAIRSSYLQVASRHGWVILQSVDEKGGVKSKNAVHQEVWQEVINLLK